MQKKLAQIGLTEEKEVGRCRYQACTGAVLREEVIVRSRRWAGWAL